MSNHSLCKPLYKIWILICKISEMSMHHKTPCKNLHKCVLCQSRFIAHTFHTMHACWRNMKDLDFTFINIYTLLQKIELERYEKTYRDQTCMHFIQRLWRLCKLNIYLLSAWTSYSFYLHTNRKCWVNLILLWDRRLPLTSDIWRNSRV